MLLLLKMEILNGMKLKKKMKIIKKKIKKIKNKVK